VVAAIVLAVAAAAAAVVGDGTLGDPWALAALASAAALTQLRYAHAPGALSYHLSLALVYAGVLLLPAPALVVIAFAQHLPAWVQERFPWYMQGFNIANITLSSLAARVVVGPLGAHPGDHSPNVWVTVVALGAAVFLLVNHGLLAGVVRLARGVTLRESNLFRPSHMTIDFCLLVMGASIALAWEIAPVAAALAALPLAVMASALRIPALEEETRTDPKTGLLNMRAFQREAGGICHRAQATGRPVSLAMIDLDYLRDINNTYGHRMGDAVIVGIAEAIRAVTRRSDLAVRFGGEEYAVLMPDTTIENAVTVLERIRAEVSTRVFEVDGALAHATVSAGIAAGPGDVDDLVARADAALYRAKEAGRNRVMTEGAPGARTPAQRSMTTGTRAAAPLATAAGRGRSSSQPPGSEDRPLSETRDRRP
jgi:diguanylate cyclase (GGDEF)-like protein